MAVLFYIAPLPARAIRILSPAAFNLRKEFMLQPAPWQTLSLYPRATIIYLVKTVSYIMIFLVTVSKIIHPGRHCEDPELVEGDEAIPKSNDKLPPPIFHTFIVLGALISVFAILVHSICDFNLHIPANAFYFMVILAIAAGLSLTRERHS
ncbi:hypothetical protein HQ584_07940, partial [Patescibacteria group bacterium]|nr:hypothetical protein [Patescibacteria group bacterium]